MMEIGYHASHEQYPPSELLANVKLASGAGFRRAMCSDHLHPWTEAQGQSGFAWSWLGAALESTWCTFGTVNAPGVRYHPAIIAQAAATLAEMYPSRFWLAVGSGEALNEAITGQPWPPKPERNARLRECVDVMRALWRGETVTHHGRVVVHEARLYSRPRTAPALFGAALSAETARFVGEWADGLITVGAPPDRLQAIIDAFRDGGGAGKPVYVQHVLSFAPTDDEARRAAHDQWRMSVLGSDVLSTLSTPAEFEVAARSIDEDTVARSIIASSDIQRHAQPLETYALLGVDAVYVHNVHRDQPRFLDAFAASVLPRFA